MLSKLRTIICLLAVIGCNKTADTTPDIENSDVRGPVHTLEVSCREAPVSYSYPVSIFPMSLTEQNCLEKIIRDIVEASDNTWLDNECYDVDAFGEIEHECNTNPYATEATFTEADLELAKNIAIDAIKLLEEFVYFESSSHITNPEHSKISQRCAEDEECNERIKAFRFTFSEQILNELPIVNTGVDVWVFPGKIRKIESSWRADVILPAEPIISSETARKSLIGRELVYGDIAGNPVSDQVTSENLHLNRLVGYRGEKHSSRLTYYLAWEFYVDDNLWTIYIDAITGSELAIMQNFFTKPSY